MYSKVLISIKRKSFAVGIRLTEAQKKAQKTQFRISESMRRAGKKYCIYFMEI
jgi:hypothetical protein